MRGADAKCCAQEDQVDVVFGRSACNTYASAVYCGNDHDAAPAPAPDPALSLLQQQVHPHRAIMRTINGKKRLDPLAAAANAAGGATALDPAPAPAPASLTVRPNVPFTLLAAVKSCLGTLQLCNPQGVALSPSLRRVCPALSPVFHCAACR